LKEKKPLNDVKIVTLADLLRKLIEACRLN